jgi:uncharacterized DUF497 family protein
VETIKIKITYGSKKRKQTLEDRGLDFKDASFIFKDTVYASSPTARDTKKTNQSGFKHKITSTGC